MGRPVLDIKNNKVESALSARSQPWVNETKLIFDDFDYPGFGADAAKVSTFPAGSYVNFFVKPGFVNPCPTCVKVLGVCRGTITRGRAQAYFVL